MPYLEQDLLREAIGNADQRHWGTTHNVNDAILKTRQTMTWIEVHSRGQTDPSVWLETLDARGSANLICKWRKMEAALKALNKVAEDAERTGGDTMRMLAGPCKEVDNITNNGIPR